MGPWHAAGLWEERLSLEGHRSVWGGGVESVLCSTKIWHPKKIFWDYFNHKEGAGSCFLVVRMFHGECYLQFLSNDCIVYQGPAYRRLLRAVAAAGQYFHRSEPK